MKPAKLIRLVIIVGTLGPKSGLSFWELMKYRTRTEIRFYTLPRELLKGVYKRMYTFTVSFMC